MQSVHITNNVGSSNPARGEVYSIQHNVKKFVCDFWQAGGFLWFPPPKNTESHNITEILLEVALNTITPPHQSHSTFYQTKTSEIYKLLVNLSNKWKRYFKVLNTLIFRPLSFCCPDSLTLNNHWTFSKHYLFKCCDFK